MTTQDEIVEQIQAKTIKRKRAVVPSKHEVTKLLKQVYDPELLGPLHFYSQDNNGLPIAKLSTTIAGEQHFSTVTATNLLEAEDWQNQEKPASYVGSTWPPKDAADLVGRPDVREVCVNHSDSTRKCRCSHKTWSDKMRNFWLQNILLQAADGRGYGLFARNPILAETAIGEYTGRLVPRSEELQEGADQYHASIAIGGYETDADKQVTTWLDATWTGSIFRFLNHSCDANARFFEGMCGMSHRIVYIETIRDIAVGEEITIDYGDKWFDKPDKPCLCGSAKCKNPPKSQDDAMELDNRSSSPYEDGLVSDSSSDISTEDDEETMSSEDDEEPPRKRIRG